ncbi:hypothetical protein GCM10027598_52880 [Amycolatopsis oliviviridis]|uniref:Uncharacterized protein n=1 Tax=Amycolatopsis oliviviridis TaxID=1471590 RepID=A0ABQ3MCH9_9PSEU|nr:hypothetical protein [Amycolatopsis oliviviridis]GHH38384.1 hypothetical protein GCM10017790_84030 [Amycolatopsis oliviviridis]
MVFEDDRRSHAEPGERTTCPPPDAREDVFRPQLELASHFDEYVDQLAGLVIVQPRGEVRDSYIDILVGLSNAAEAFRRSEAGDAQEAAERLRSAVDLLSRARTDGFVLVHA